MKKAAAAPDLTGVSDQDWQEARRRLAIIQHLAATPERTRSSRGDLKKGAITYVKALRPLIPLIEPAAGA